jgi:hypothetical protein
MKLAITISAALALVAFNQVFAAAQTRQDFLVKVADRVGTYPPQWPTRPRHRFVYYRSYGLYPVACEAVIFRGVRFARVDPPRSGLMPPSRGTCTCIIEDLDRGRQAAITVIESVPDVRGD